MNRLIVFCAAGWLLLSGMPCLAQNVTGYDRMQNPYLLLIREPAVQKDLALTAVQKEKLIRINNEVDGPLLAARNLSAADATKQWKELLDSTQKQLNELLSSGQRKRIDQIRMRVRGIRSVLDPAVVDHLSLSDQQTEDIQAVLDEAQQDLAEQNKRQRSGESITDIRKKILAIRRREQRDVLRILNRDQQQQFSRVLGRNFDLSKLGHVSFQSPELVDSGGWINSRPLRMADLRGQVVVVHFWAFG